MARMDHWTDETVDCAIRLLVEAEKAVQVSEPDLYDRIRKFLDEEA